MVTTVADERRHHARVVGASRESFVTDQSDA